MCSRTFGKATARQRLLYITPIGLNKISLHSFAARCSFKFFFFFGKIAFDVQATADAWSEQEKLGFLQTWTEVRAVLKESAVPPC
jgi:hypothetical protein